MPNPPEAEKVMDEALKKEPPLTELVRADVFAHVAVRNWRTQQVLQALRQAAGSDAFAVVDGKVLKVERVPRAWVYNAPKESSPTSPLYRLLTPEPKDA